MRIIHLPVLALLALAACVDDPLVVFAPNLSIDGQAVTCADLGGTDIRVQLTGRDGRVEESQYFDCAEAEPSLAVAPGEWSLFAELLTTTGRYALVPRWLEVADVDELVVPLDFDYGTFALTWSITIDGAPAACADVESQEVAVELTSSDVLRTQSFPCGGGAAASAPLPHGKTYSLSAELVHPTHVYPYASASSLRLTESTGPTPLELSFEVSSAQIPDA